MILLTIQHDRHVEPGDLIRLIDGECRSEEERIARAHLAECVECRGMADRLSRLTGRFNEAVFELDDPVPALPEVPAARRDQARTPHRPSWWSRPALRAAALLAIVTLAVFASPARAWVWHALRSLLAPRVETAPERPQTASLVSFVPAGVEFTVDFASLQTAGTLSIAVDTGASATARILGGDGKDELVVLQSGLAVRNSQESSASYELKLPAFCESVEVRIGGRVVGRHEVREVARRVRWEIDLARGGG